MWDADDAASRSATLARAQGRRSAARRSARTAAASSPRQQDKTARLWDAATGTAARDPRWARGLSWLRGVQPGRQPRRHRVSWDKTARLWDAATGAAAGTARGARRDRVCSAAFSPDGTRVVTASRGQDGAAVGRPDRQAARRRSLGHEGDVSQRGVQPGRHAARHRQRGTRRRGCGTPPPASRSAPLAGHDGRRVERGVQPGRPRVVTACADKTARVWDAATGTAARAPRWARGNVWSARRSARTAARRHRQRDRTARLWDAKTGAPLATLAGHEGDVQSAALLTRAPRRSEHYQMLTYLTRGY